MDSEDGSAIAQVSAASKAGTGAVAGSQSSADGLFRHAPVEYSSRQDRAAGSLGRALAPVFPNRGVTTARSSEASAQRQRSILVKSNNRHTARRSSGPRGPRNVRFGFEYAREYSRVVGNNPPVYFKKNVGIVGEECEGKYALSLGWEYEDMLPSAIPSEDDMLPSAIPSEDTIARWKRYRGYGLVISACHQERRREIHAYVDA
jgi:hypothetical protein